ncbi:MAG: hypothetical protein ACKPFA_21545 [Dolichospermum sp.]
MGRPSGQGSYEGPQARRLGESPGERDARKPTRDVGVDGFDFELLKIDFEFLQDEGFNLDLTGFNELELSFLDEEEEETPDFQPVGEDKQGKLDEKQQKEIKCLCPHCGEEFTQLI